MWESAGFCINVIKGSSIVGELCLVIYGKCVGQADQAEFPVSHFITLPVRCLTICPYRMPYITALDILY
jgi:hypothetical protein